MSTPICPKCGGTDLQCFQGNYVCFNRQCEQIKPFTPPPDNAAPEPVKEAEKCHVTCPRCESNSRVSEVECPIAKALYKCETCDFHFADTGTKPGAMDKPVQDDPMLMTVEELELEVHDLRAENARLVAENEALRNDKILSDSTNSHIYGELKGVREESTKLRAENERQALLLDSGETQIETLRSQLAEKERQLQNWQQDARSAQAYIASLGKMLDANGDDLPEARINELRAEIEELNKDKRRLDELQKLVRSKGAHGLSFDFHKEDGSPMFRIMWYHHLGEFVSNIRQAIDTAATKENP